MRTCFPRASARIGRIAVAALALVTGTVAAFANPILLYDPATDEVLEYEDLDRHWHPASLTKLMTAYLTFVAVKEGKLAWEAILPLSEKARLQPATRIGLRAGIDVTVAQGVKGLIMRSANDFAMALAEAISGSEEAFAEEMNRTAGRLGMTRTHFTNPHGLPNPQQVTTARDMALLARAIMREFPEQSDVFAAKDMPIGRATLHTVNTILRTFEGADGMKTGFTCSSGYNIVASATRNGRRLIAVVLGGITGDERNKQAEALLAQGFDQMAKPRELPPVLLAAIAPPPMEPLPAEDLSHVTRTYKCGNGGGRVARVRLARDPKADVRRRRGG